MSEPDNQATWAKRAIEFLDEIAARFASQNTLVAARRSTTIVVSLFGLSLALDEHQKFSYFSLNFDFSSVHFSFSLLIISTIFLINLTIHYLFRNYSEGKIESPSYTIFRSKAISFKKKYESIYSSLKGTAVIAINQILVDRIKMVYKSEQERDEAHALLSNTHDTALLIYSAGDLNMLAAPFGPVLSKLERSMIQGILNSVSREIWKFRISRILAEIGFLSRYVFVPFAIYVFSTISLVARVSG